MFSLLTLQPTHTIVSFDELAKRTNITPIIDENFNQSLGLDIPILKLIDESRHLKEFDNEELAQLIEPNNVFLADGTNLEIFSHALLGLPIKVSDEKIVFMLLARFPIHTSEESDKEWVEELKRSIQTFYEIGFYNYGYQLYLHYYRVKAIPILRKLYREGKIDNNGFKPLTLTELMQSFTFKLYALIFIVVALIGENVKEWIEK